METGEPTESELAGNYDENILNKEVRDNKEVTINNEKLNNKLKMVFELSNSSIWKYNIQEMEKVKILDMKMVVNTNGILIVEQKKLPQEN